MSRIAAGAMLCLGLAACPPQDANGANMGEPPCPNVISESEAIRKAGEYAVRQGIDTEEYVARPSWNHAEWSVFISVPDKPYSLGTVTLSPDNRVTGCTGLRACASPIAKPADRCALAAKQPVSEVAAIRAALDYLGEHGIDHATDGAHVVWWAAHWSVWYVQTGPLFPDSDFTVFLSPDGSEGELVPALDIPSLNGFLFRQPGTE